ncbi:MAG: GCN5-related N-acetyltransferase [Clostridia bacterium]|jgi:putative acetyltransferase|nr:GCN5-related N-acetyltransferase [Clostridia bacterium]
MIKKLNQYTEEINQVMKIWKDSTIKAHAFIPEEYWLRSYNRVKEKYIPMADTYVYAEENEIKGFISILDQEYIGALFVDISSQGQGIGRRLIEHAKEAYGSLSLAVYKKNEKAVSFYELVGFQIKCEQLNEETNEPEYIMMYEKK